MDLVDWAEVSAQLVLRDYEAGRGILDPKVIIYEKTAIR